MILRAFELVDANDRTGALELSELSLGQQPGNRVLLWSRAHILAKLGDCAPLVDVARRIRQVGHAGLSKEALANLEQLQRECLTNAPK